MGDCMGIWYQEVLGDIPRCRTSGQDGLLANRSQKLLSSMTGCERFQRMQPAVGSLHDCSRWILRLNGQTFTAADLIVGYVPGR